MAEVDASAGAVTTEPAKETPKDPANDAKTQEAVVVPPEAKPDAEAAAVAAAEKAKLETPKDSKDPNASSEKKTVVPEKYDLKLPEGSKMDSAQVERIASFAKEQGLSDAQAQAILDRESASDAARSGKTKEELDALPGIWLGQAQNDKEIGGENFKKNSELANRVVDKYGSDAFKKVLIDTGLGNHPELLRFALRLGKTMKEDELVVPGNGSSGVKSAEDVLYPSQQTA